MIAFDLLLSKSNRYSVIRAWVELLKATQTLTWPEYNVWILNTNKEAASNTDQKDQRPKQRGRTSSAVPPLHKFLHLVLYESGQNSVPRFHPTPQPVRSSWISGGKDEGKATAFVSWRNLSKASSWSSQRQGQCKCMQMSTSGLHVATTVRRLHCGKSSIYTHLNSSCIYHRTQPDWPRRLSPTCHQGPSGFACFAWRQVMASQSRSIRRVPSRNGLKRFATTAPMPYPKAKWNKNRP